MLRNWLGRLDSVSVASSRAEREAVYRFRYEVFIEELNYEDPHADHANKMIRDEEDDCDSAVIFYTGRPDCILSSIRVAFWNPGEIPEHFFRQLSLHLIPGIEGFHTAELGRLLIRPTLRGKLLLPSLLTGIFEWGLRNRTVDLVFLFCVPGLARHYRALGARPYGGRLISHPDLPPFIPLFVVTSDYDHFRACGSILAPIAKRHFGGDAAKPAGLSRLQPLLERSESLAEFDSRRVWKEFQTQLLSPRGSTGFLDSLSPAALRRLTDSGFLLKVDAGDILTRKGSREREMFLILEGFFEVVDGRGKLGIMEKGDPFGEIAFFSESGVRTASVRALSAGEVLVLRRRFLQELSRSDPDAAYQILFNLARVLSERLVNVLSFLDEREPEA